MYGTHKENAGGFEKNSIWFFYGMMSAKRVVSFDVLTQRFPRIT